MPVTIEIDSTLTDRYQTTVPEPVRRALRLGKRDKIRYSIQPNGAVLMTRTALPQDSDPVLASFLGFWRAAWHRTRSKFRCLTPACLAAFARWWARGRWILTHHCRATND